MQKPYNNPTAELVTILDCIKTDFKKSQYFTIWSKDKKHVMCITFQYSRCLNLSIPFFFFLICYAKVDNYNVVIATGLIYFFCP